MLEEILRKRREEANQEVILKLKKWQIPYILGSMGAGITTELLCEDLWFSISGMADTKTMRWSERVEYIIKEIKNQTGINEERVEATDKCLIEIIGGLISRKCKEWEGILQKVPPGGWKFEMTADGLDKAVKKYPLSQTNRGQK